MSNWLNLMVEYNRQNIEEKKIAEIKALLEKGEDVNKPIEGKYFLEAAIERRYGKMLNFLLQNGVNIETRDKYNNTPLMYAIINNNKKAIELLLAKGAEVNAVNQFQVTPLMLASEDGNPETIELLIQNGANLNAVDQNQQIALKYAVTNGNIEAIEVLIQNGADVNAFDKDHKTALMYAVTNGNIEAIEVLIQNGADVNAVDKDHKTPLMIAITNGNIEAIEVLIQHGADVNAVVNNQRTPLMYAVTRGNAQVIKILIQHGADVNAVDKYHKTPLMIAITNGNIEAIEILIQHGADVNAVVNNQRTPLMYAVTRGNAQAVELLIQNGANLDAVDMNNKTPLMYAINANNLDKAKLLIDHDAAVEGLSEFAETTLKLLVHSSKENHIKAFKTYLFDIEDLDVRQEIINTVYKVENHKLLEALGSPDYKLVPLEFQIIRQLSLDLEKSPNSMKYTALVNILNSVGEPVPSELKHLVNDYSFERSLSKEQKKLIADQLPKLSKHFIREALYKDLSNIGNKFKIGKNHPVMEEVKGQLEKIYTTIDPEVFEDAKENLKLILLKERVKHKLENENDVNEIVNIIDKGKKQGVSAQDISRNVQNRLLSNDYGISPEKINNICNNFEILRPIHSIESLQYRAQQNALNQMNEDFRLEISAALDLTHTKMTGKEVLYRGIRVDFSNKEIQKLFEVGHKKLSKSASHFLFDKKIAWNEDAGEWHANAVYTSFNPSISKEYLHDGNSILFEYCPKAGELGIEGAEYAENQYEVLFNHLVGDNIKAIYKIENHVITDIFYNPYYESRDNEPELSFKEGENIADASQKYVAAGIQEYQNMKFHKNRDQYRSPEDFRARYGKKEIEAKREKLYEERGYKTHKEQFEALPKENWPSTYIKPHSEDIRRMLASEEKFMANKEKTPSENSDKTSNAARMSNPFSYISSTIKQIKGAISSLEKEFIPETTTNVQDNQSYKTATSASSTGLITSYPNINNQNNQEQSWVTTERVVQAFDAIHVIQKQVKLAKVLYILGGQVLESSKQMAEDLLDEKVNKREFIDTLQKVSKDIETDISKLDKLSEELKKTGRSDSKLYRDELIDLENKALEIEQELKTFEGKEQIPKGRLEKLENKTKEYSQKIEDLAKEFKKVKGKTVSPDKQPEISIENPVLKEIAEQYKTLSKEGKVLLEAAKGKHNKPPQHTHEKQSKSKHKIDETKHSQRNSSRNRPQGR